MHAGRHPQHFNRLWLARQRLTVLAWLPATTRMAAAAGLPLSAVDRAAQGVLHGRRLGFGGTEARGLIADWARVGLNNHYAASGMDEPRCADGARAWQRAGGADGARLVGPTGSMRTLLAKLPNVDAQLRVLSRRNWARAPIISRG